MGKELDRVNADLAAKDAEVQEYLRSIPADKVERSDEQTIQLSKLMDEHKKLSEKREFIRNTEYQEAEFRARSAEFNAQKSGQTPGADITRGVASGIEVADKPVYDGPHSFARAVTDYIVSETERGNTGRGRAAVRSIERYVNREINLANEMSRAAGTPTQQISVYEEGGIWIGTSTTADMIDKGFNNSVVLRNTQKVTLTGPVGMAEFVAIDEDSRKDGFRFGGLDWYPRAELEAYVATNTKWAKVTLMPRQIGAAHFSSTEFVADLGAMEGEINRLIAGPGLEFALQKYAIDGNGTGIPMVGHINSPCKIVVTKNSTTPNFSILYEDWEAMKNRLWLGGLNRAEVYYNRSLEKNFRGMYIPTGDSGAIPDMLWERAKNGEPAYLDGIPAYPIEQANIPGDVGDIILAVPSEYIFATKGNMTMQTSIHVKLLNGQNTTVFSIAVDGQSRWKVPVTPYKGTETTSPVVMLSARKP